MLKNLKMGSVITTIVAAITVISMGAVFYISNRNITSMLINDVENSMQTSLEAKTKLIDVHIKCRETAHVIFQRTRHQSFITESR